MKFLLGIFLIIGGICGITISFLSNIVVNSSLPIIDGLELSLGFALFSIVVFLTGVYDLLSAN